MYEATLPAANYVAQASVTILSDTDTVECASCHEVHNPVESDGQTRVAAADLCGECHIK